MSDKQASKSSSTSIAGILTAIAGLLTALAALIGVLNAAGVIQIFVPTNTATPTALAIQPSATVVMQATPTRPAQTPVPSAQVVIVVTATPPPSLPTQTTSTQGLEQVVDNFDGISATFVQENFIINKNAGNEGTLRLVGIPHVSQGSQALAFEYNIRSAPPNDYIGFDRNLPLADWSKSSKLCMWIESDGSNRTLVIQFGENSNHFVLGARIPLAPGATDQCVPLHTSSDINLRLIGYYGIYVEGPPQSQGLIYIDNVRLAP